MRKTWCFILPIIVFLVSYVDLVVTLHCNNTYSRFEEANPIAEYVWKEYGDNVFAAFKLIVTLVSCFGIWFVLQYKNKSWRIAVSVFGLIICCFLVSWWIFWIFL